MVANCAALIGFLLAGADGFAQSTEPQAPGTEARSRQAADSAPYWANRGRWNFGMQLGYGVENAIPHNISHINMLILQPQAGLIVRDFEGGPFRRFQIVNEGILGSAVHPGGHLLGTSLFFRFDFNTGRRLVPFLNLGSGILHTTLDLRAPEISGHLQFLSAAGLGVQYFFRPQRAFVIEYRYAHMSNAGIKPPNEGFNASMLSLGLRWHRRPQPAGATRPSRNPLRLLARGFRRVSGL